MKVAGPRVGNCLAKVNYWVTLLHKSSKFFDCVEEAFGKEVGNARSVKTRWNSTVKQAAEFMATLEDEGKFDKAIETYNDKKATAQKLNQLQKEILAEVIEVLELFTEATMRTEADEMVTINLTIPLVLGVIRSLQELLADTKFCAPLIEGLLTSMFRRFNGLLQMVGFKTSSEPAFTPIPELKKGKLFGDEIYLLSTFLDPAVKLSWIDAECGFLNEDEKCALKETVQQKVLNAIGRHIPAKAPAPPPSYPANSGNAKEPEKKKSRLLQYRIVPVSSAAVDKTPLQEIHDYLNNPEVDEITHFWARNRFDLRKLSELVLAYLCVPASSSPVERVFSAAGFINRPHRSSMSYKTLQALVFLKVNKKLLDSLK